MRAILTFHSVDDSGSVLSYPTAAFASLLGALRAAGMPILDLDALLAPGTPRGVALTFDDGMRSVLTRALPVLREHGAPAHLFLTTGAVGRERWATPRSPEPAFDMLGWDEVAKLHEAGVRIEGHTHTHPDVRELNDGGITQECESADRLIEQRVGRRPRYFAYPFGFFSARARELARARYRASVTTQLRELGDDDDAAALPRLDTYYLQAPWTYRHLEARLPRAYLALRGALRRLRGSECIPA